MKRKGKDQVDVGIDPSLTGTGIVVLAPDGVIVEQKLIKTKPTQEIEDRILHIRKEIGKTLRGRSVKLIRMEGLSFGSKGASMMQLAGLHFYIRIFLLRAKYPFIVVPPTTLKKFITGSGGGKKELMLMKIYKKYGIEFTDNNLADAFALAKYYE